MNKRLEPDDEVTLDAPSRPTSLRIQYTTTRVLRESASIARRNPGVVGIDRSPLTEAFKLLRAQLLQRMRAGGWNTVAVTSVRPTESKSTATINLALSIAAELDKTALLVDADLVTPHVDAFFGLHGAPGLTDHLLDSLPLKDLIVNPGIDHLVILPAGRIVANSSELLATHAVSDLIAELKGRYPERYIIFDSPAVLSADGLSLFEKVDAILLVAERNQTTRRDLEECATVLSRFNVIGSVLCEPIPTEKDALPAKSRRSVLRRR